MKTARALLLCIALPLAAFAADPPEVVYAKFHRAAASGDLDEMLRYAPAAQRAEINAMSPAQKQAQVKMVAVLLPRAFVVQSKTPNKGGQGLLLQVSGPGELIPGLRPETLYGSIQMLMEGGEWKVGEMNWSNTKPAAMQVHGAPSAPAGKAPAPAARGGATAIGTQPDRKLGTARPPCVYTAVMTAEDLENCR